MEAKAEPSFFPHPEAPRPVDFLNQRLAAVGILVDNFSRLSKKAGKEEISSSFARIAAQREVFSEALNSEKYGVDALRIMENLLNPDSMGSRKVRESMEFTIKLAKDNKENIANFIDDQDLKISDLCLNVLKHDPETRKGIAEKYRDVVQKLYQQGNYMGYLYLGDTMSSDEGAKKTIQFFGEVLRDNPKMRRYTLSKLHQAEHQYRNNPDIILSIRHVYEDNSGEIFRGFLQTDTQHGGEYEDAVLFLLENSIIGNQARAIINAKLAISTGEEKLAVLATLTYRNQLSFVNPEIGFIRKAIKDPVLFKSSSLQIILRSGYFRKDPEIQNLLSELTKKTHSEEYEKLKSLGLDADEFFSTWVACDPDSWGVKSNMEAIQSLENSYPGAVKYLRNNFGIINFGRYPKYLLIKQYEERDNKILPYGIVVYPLDDWNGAFTEYSHPLVLASLMTQLEDKYLIRAVEVGGEYTLAKMLRKLDNKYSSTNKISFMVLGGHGNPDSITLGSQSRYSHLKKQDIVRAVPALISEPFERNATIILESCSTGQEKGIAETLSQTIGATVIAPNVDTSMRSIAVTLGNNGKLLFDVEYKDVEPTTYSPTGVKP